MIAEVSRFPRLGKEVDQPKIWSPRFLCLGGSSDMSRGHCSHSRSHSVRTAPQSGDMRRREFILLVGAAALLPFAARTADRRKRIGVLTLSSSADEDGRTRAFTAGLRDLGYVGGQTADIDYFYAGGDTDRLKQLASELVSLGPDVVYTSEPSSARAVKAVAPDLPIVCPGLVPYATDLFSGFARPGGSVTGLTNSVENLYGKWVEIALDVVPGLTRIGLLVNPAGANRAFLLGQVETASHARGLATSIEYARFPDEIAPAFDRLAKAQAQVVVVQPNGMLNNQYKAVVRFALESKLPTISQDRHHVEAGGFLSYGISQTENARRAAGYVDKILHGAKPGDLPIEFPTKIEFVINLKTAKALGIPISRDMLLRADAVIE